MNSPSDHTAPRNRSRIRALLSRHPRMSIFLFMLFASTVVAWPIYTDSGSLVAGVAAILSLLALLYALEHSLASSWPYHYAWAAVCSVLAIILPVAGSLYYDRPIGDVVVNTLLVGGPLIGAVLYGVLRE